MNTRRGHRGIIYTGVVSAAFLFMMCIAPSIAGAAGASYSTDTQISVNGIALKILAGGTANSVMYGAASMTVVAGTGHSLTIQALDAGTVLTNDGGLPACSRPDAQITITTGTVTVTPAVVGCFSVSASSGGGSVLLYEGSKQTPVPSSAPVPATATVSTQTSVLIKSATASSIVFAKNLRQGMDDPDVSNLQQFLDTHGYPVASTGWGSINKLATLFGAKTTGALKRYQADANLPTTGYFGPITRAWINAHL